MPLNTQVTRNGKIHKPESGWTGLGLSCFLTVAIKDALPQWEYREGKRIGDIEEGQFVDFTMSPVYYMDIDVPLWKKGTQTLMRDHTFGPFKDEDGEFTVFYKKGDVLSMYRS
jgi:hypothetical protein